MVGEATVRKPLIKRTLLNSSVLLATIGLLVGCNQAVSETTALTVKPVKLLPVNDLMTSSADSFLAQIDATKRAQLSFQVAGQIDALTVRMGDEVQQGELLARLDQADLQLQLDAAGAQYALAQTQWQRAQSLYHKKLISTDVYDQAETAFTAARATYEQAKTDLSYAMLKAPFNGVVSYTYVKPNQVVAAKQQILNLIDNSSLDVSFTIPVSYVEANGLDKLKNLPMWVTMDSEPDKPIPAQFKEITTRPDADTNSYTAIVTITRPQDRNLLSGMTGQVSIGKANTTPYLTLPEAAWVSKKGSQGEVWLVDEENQQLKKVTLSLNANGEVISGLNRQDRVVIAGVENLAEGQVVKAWQREEGI
ncbi:efflux RND transporter periplasmic adaptor subunit [Vibrio navarrensis]